ncbi:hypothetical protein BIWAKO_00461 [Bosea sp. BIWAKO-01]|nr:hypothetical protein BIWAKO_00461 [Bosea sp. BIWAKO-01]
MKARAIIEAVDKTGKTFDSIAGKMKAVDKAAAALGKAKGLDGMSRQIDAVAVSLDKVSKIDAFRGSQASFAAARTTFREAQANVARLGVEMAKASAPTAALSREYAAYVKALNFEKEINAAEARGELTKAQSEKLRREARNVGAEGIGFSGEQLAKLGREYVQAGYEEHAAAFTRAAGTSRMPMSIAFVTKRKIW